MKMFVTFKDPDQLYEALEDKKREITKELMTNFGLSRSGAEAEADERLKAFDQLIKKYFPYSEYLTVELDSETQSIRVVPDYE